VLGLDHLVRHGDHAMSAWRQPGAGSVSAGASAGEQRGGCGTVPHSDVVVTDED
jgi:hypothetical protein